MLLCIPFLQKEECIMSKLESKIYSLQRLDEQANKDGWMNSIHPIVKLWLTLFYISLVMSCEKYNVMGVLEMSLYPIICFNIGELSLKKCMKWGVLVLPFVFLLGIWNPFFDCKPIMWIGSVTITGGMVSLFTLMTKGVLVLCAVYMLVATTSIDKICSGLEKIYVPKMLVTVILLTYRYITVLMEEGIKITQAYALRAPKQKGLSCKVWGTLIGQWLLRTIERANQIYDSMLLRGYDMESRRYNKDLVMRRKDYIWLCVWTIVLIILKRVPVFVMIGDIFMG